MDRRYFLKGLGTTLALPYMNSLQGDVKKDHQNNKMLFLSFGWGVTKQSWYPNSKQRGADYELSEGLKPLARHKKDFSLILGTEHQFNKQGHWGSTMFLTGANRYAVPGQSFSNTISCDQIAAQAWGANNRFSSLQFDCAKASSSGHGPGLSMSWNRSGKPMAGMQNPVLVYNKLFGNEGMSIAEKQELISKRGSSLDAILSDAKTVSKKLNSEDKDKLNEYFDSVREIELQLSKEQAWLGKAKPKAPLQEPQKGLKGYDEIKIMYDLLVAALQTDSTRVITYRQPVESLLQSLDVGITSHNMSHYGQGDRLAVSKLRDEKQSELLAYLMDRMKQVKDVNGVSLFDSTTLVYGSNISTSHTLTNCPVLVAGNKNILKLGEHKIMPNGTPLNNLWLTLLNANGLKQKSFGDSTGMIEDILV
ncbi:DUF1552 domain-containing protein [Lentisphaera marina]|uniref:DUF1552 domain-containing protein n=1 Tax=Lentisphaera marina TaxID=1111041 RepID=UPI0023662352|nr:DUF1552 domain-containing protein [Lentisphaera marina]MDD7986039.1 DUF1552 domain-containing protein [Lentisphaera marina]